MNTTVKYVKGLGWVAGYYNNDYFDRLPMSKNYWKSFNGAKKWIEKNYPNAKIMIEE